MPSSPRLSIETSLAALDPGQWNALAGDQPFVRHEFLSALHDTGCAAPDTGWTPYFLTLRRGERLAGAVPLYLKMHSRGEYVFDFAWADAFERHGLRYYPKLLSAIPFTPVAGARLLAADDADRVLLAQGLVELAQRLKVSSLHLLFPYPQDLAALREAGYMIREGVQFHWTNPGYADMDQFLAAMSHDKRKKIRQDRKKVAAAGITYRWLTGAQIDAASLDFFYRCYCQTYYEHGNPPYLNDAFFARIRAELPDSMVLVLAMRGDEPVAAALNLRGGGALYGRYWGSAEYVPGLHFETCYLQAIEYCIVHGLSRFEGGAQGEHKMARGLLPTPTWSAHWVADRRFADAIQDFLDHETTAMQRYVGELETHAPFKRVD
ncbi:GNAT family N-acetyltransferase [Bordetella genomosp. 13]|uniref:GNAT family N-acetyltransferase n=1 Tax=Bordetella genomosp. 13 TaxID=463040 RepID=UPI0011A75297|nr:GNAT family N-acetyltransferase [Bordetella genomosp. 13]